MHSILEILKGQIGMPGQLIEANCPCGYSASLSPGMPEVVPNSELKVMAYTADQKELATVNVSDALKLGLLVIADEYNAATRFTPLNFAKSSQDGLYDCPKCKQRSLEIRHLGFWD